MNRSPLKNTKSAINRQTGKHQVDEQRACILEAAEKLFLQNGLENTTMVQIANQASITKVTLYRYFANRDVIAYEIHIRMMKRIISLVEQAQPVWSIASMKNLAQAMIRNFERLRDEYRYMGMFDKIYLDNPPESALTQWTKRQLLSFSWEGITLEDVWLRSPEGNRLVMVMNTVIWFLEKLALRGELTWSDRTLPIEEHLKLFEEMVLGYIERCMADS